MDVVNLTRQLVDIPSISGQEAAVGTFVAELLRGMGATVELFEVEPGRFNVLGVFGETPLVTFSTHLDTVPPFIASSEDAGWVYGRGSCDAKGILACMIIACERLLAKGETNFGILAVVGEERGSAGAKHAGGQSRGSRFLINGEPTEGKLAIGSKGALRLKLIAEGRSAHSAYPELGDSAIDRLVAALSRILAHRFPVDPVLGDCTVNIGTISGGSAPNVIADHAEAELLVRLVADASPVVDAIRDLCGEGITVQQTLCIDAVHLRSLPGFETCVVRYTSDVPLLCPAWGEGLMLGPGTIHVAHTLEERVAKDDLHQAVETYVSLGVELLAQCR